MTFNYTEEDEQIWQVILNDMPEDVALATESLARKSQAMYDSLKTMGLATFSLGFTEGVKMTAKAFPEIVDMAKSALTE